MKFILLTTLLLTYVNSIAQECGYKEYYYLVESAAEDYSNKEYKRAKNKLKRAFAMVDFPLGEGLDLALAVALKNNDDQWAEQIAIQLAKGGVDFRYFVRLKKFDWYEKFKDNFEMYSDFYSKNFEPDLRKEIILLIQEDKEFNQKYHDWRTGKIEMSLQNLIDESAKILLDFKSLTNQYGFPYEYLTGYYYNKRKNRIEYYKTDVLLMHIYQRGVFVYMNKLNDIVCNGGLHPNYIEILPQSIGLSNGGGVNEEMKLRYELFRNN